MPVNKRILLISTEFPPAPGGIGSHAYALADGLHQLNWEVLVATEQNYTTDAEIKTFNESQKFRIQRLMPTPSVWTLIKKIVSLIFLVLKFKPSFVVGTGKHGAWFAFLVGKICFKKVFLMGHGTEFTVTMSKNSQRINKFVFNNVNLIIAVSNYTRSVIEEVGIKNKIVVIHNGADSNNFHLLPHDFIQDFKIKRNLLGQVLILTVGNVTKRKGQEWVIRSMPQILRKYPNVHYYCIGINTITDELKALAMELNVQSNVHFLGPIPTMEVNTWMNAADIFAMTSVHHDGDFEGFGISVIEAALSGKPAVVTNQSGVVESIDVGKTGFAVPERDFDSIADKMIGLIDNEQLRLTMGRNAMNRALKDFTWQVVIKKYEEEMIKL